MNFKFFEGQKQRVFTDYMDAMDDYFLGGIQHAREIPAQQLKTFNLNVMNNPVGRIPSYNLPFTPVGIYQTRVVNGTIQDLILGRLGIELFVDLTIRRGGETQDTFSSYTILTYDNVDTMNQRGLIFDSEDMVVVRYKIN